MVKMQQKKYPIGIQTFEKLRREGYMYVDKTAEIYRLVSSSTPFFLSRPRRFGKSLLLSTIESYFSGKKELFQGLAIEKLESEWKSYPILHLDLNAERYSTPEALNHLLESKLSQWERTYGRDKYEDTLSTRFAGCIRRACETTGMPVVVLIDEYDKPLLQSISNEALQDDYRRTLKAFYSVLKSEDRYLRFVFITGVTKFSQVSVFSDLNQLNDISLKPSYATLCGITERELQETFSQEIVSLAESNDLHVDQVMSTLKQRYNGYHFGVDTIGVYNPFSVLNVLDSKRFDSYWFQTGTPTYLVELLKQSDYDLRLLVEGVEVGLSAFSEYRADARNPLPMIYQSGYLTIKEYDKEVNLYKLGFPNDEVRYGFLNFLLPYYTKVTEDETGFHIASFMRHLRSGDVAAFMERLKSFFAGIPYELSDNTERHYQVIFHIVFTLMGQYIQSEVRSAHGRADAVVQTSDAIYVFEFKLNGTAEEALRQIDQQEYLLPYSCDGRKRVGIGVEFSKQTRNIDRWLVENV